MVKPWLAYAPHTGVLGVVWRELHPDQSADFYAATSTDGGHSFSAPHRMNSATAPPPLVRGDDLIALGLKPGPKFGEILEAVETRQLEGSLQTRDEALEWVKREYSLQS